MKGRELAKVFFLEVTGATVNRSCLNTRSAGYCDWQRSSWLSWQPIPGSEMYMFTCERCIYIYACVWAYRQCNNPRVAPVINCAAFEVPACTHNFSIFNSGAVCLSVLWALICKFAFTAQRVCVCVCVCVCACVCNVSNVLCMWMCVLQTLQSLPSPLSPKCSPQTSSLSSSTL